MHQHDQLFISDSFLCSVEDSHFIILSIIKYYSIRLIFPVLGVPFIM